MALTKLQYAQIKSLMKDERWDSVTRFVALKIDQWQGQQINGGNAFEELRMLHKRDGMVEGVNEVFNQMEQGAYE
jgi:hypothetical protein